MRDADRPIDRLPEAPSLPALHETNETLPFAVDEEPADDDTVRELNSGPARGIVLGLAPALLIWAGLIALFVKLVR